MRREHDPDRELIQKTVRASDGDDIYDFSRFSRVPAEQDWNEMSRAARSGASTLSASTRRGTGRPTRRAHAHSTWTCVPPAVGGPRSRRWSLLYMQIVEKVPADYDSVAFRKDGS